MRVMAGTKPSPYLFLLLLAGLAMIAVSTLWWLVVFTKLIAAGTLGVSQSVACFGTTSALCDLALSLCDAKHLFSINFYSPYLLWLGVLVLSIGALGKLRLP